jgi:hypothetical protein
LALSIGDSLVDAMGKTVEKTSGWLMTGRCQPDPGDCTKSDRQRHVARRSLPGPLLIPPLTPFDQQTGG